jgi:hypothetical protein
MGAALLAAYVLLVVSVPINPILWAYPIAGVIGGMWCLHQEDRLKVAGRGLCYPATGVRGLAAPDASGASSSN